MSNLFNFFPLTVYSGQMEQHEALKERLVPKIMSRWTPRQDYPYAWTGDVYGSGFLHQEEEFSDLFRGLAPHVYAYMDSLSLNRQNLDLFIQRSWPVVTATEQEVSPHQHNQSHISLVYYLQKPARSGGIRFSLQSAQNEIVPRLFAPHMEVFRSESTILNSNSVDIETEEGQVLVFPSKAWHGTLKSEAQEERISISADIAIMLKHDNNFEYVMPNFAAWRRLD